MKDEVLDALSHSVIEEISRKKIVELNARHLVMEGSIDWDKFQELLPKERSPFDIAEVRDEKHLREIVMDRVLEAAARNITVSAKDGSTLPIAELPEERQAEYLNKIIMEMLDSISGPGPVLRRSIAVVILNYRMRNRLKALLPTLRPSSTKFKRSGEGIAHIEKLIQLGMSYFDAWTFLGYGPMGEQSDLGKQNPAENLSEQETKD